MGDARRQQMMNVEQLRQVVEAGPPPAPSSEQPGPVLAACRDMLAELRATCDGGKQVTAEEMITGFAHLFDMNSWRTMMQRFEQMRALLEQADKRVVVPR
jgi:hypothetical protein